MHPDFRLWAAGLASFHAGKMCISSGFLLYFKIAMEKPADHLLLDDLDIRHSHIGYMVVLDSHYQRVAAKVLANRPGFPFHGNAFFRECGDAFAAIALDNPATWHWHRSGEGPVTRSY